MSNAGENSRNAPPIRRFRTSSADEAAEFLLEHFGSKTAWNSPTRAADLLIDIEVTAIGTASLMRALLSSYDISRVQEDSIQIIAPVSGALLKRSPGTPDVNLRGSSGGASVSRAYERSSYTVDQGSAIIVSMRTDELQARARLLVDGELDGPSLSRMRPELAASDPLTQALLRSMATAWNELTSLSSLGLAGIAAAGYERLLTELAAAAIFPEVGVALRKPAPDAGSPAVRKARDYIAAHAAEPIDIGAIAHSLGVSMRSLQEAFQRHLGCSPRRFLMDCRLRLARQALLTMPAGNISEIALASGFSDLGAFAARYRETFGELPSETRRRARA